jgi:hypothetical protein
VRQTPGGRQRSQQPRHTHAGDQQALQQRPTREHTRHYESDPNGRIEQRQPRTRTDCRCSARYRDAEGHRNQHAKTNDRPRRSRPQVGCSSHLRIVSPDCSSCERPATDSWLEESVPSSLDLTLPRLSWIPRIRSCRPLPPATIGQASRHGRARSLPRALDYGPRGVAPNRPPSTAIRAEDRSRPHLPAAVSVASCRITLQRPTVTLSCPY